MIPAHILTLLLCLCLVSPVAAHPFVSKDIQFYNVYTGKPITWNTTANVTFINSGQTAIVNVTDTLHVVTDYEMLSMLIEPVGAYAITENIPFNNTGDHIVYLTPVCVSYRGFESFYTPRSSMRDYIWIDHVNLSSDNYQIWIGDKR